MTTKKLELNIPLNLKQTLHSHYSFPWEVPSFFDTTRVVLLVSAHRSKNSQSAPAPLPPLGEYPPLGKTGRLPKRPRLARFQPI